MRAGGRDSSKGGQGIFLGNPPLREVWRLSPIGDTIPSSYQDILRQCQTSSEVPFLLWLSKDHDVFCSIHKLNAAVVRESYSLHAQTEQESMRVIRCAAQLFGKRAERGAAFAFVADRYAELRSDFHWDDFIVGTATKPPEWPMYLGFSKGFNKSRLIPTSFEALDKTKYVLISSGKDAPIELVSG